MVPRLFELMLLIFLISIGFTTDSTAAEKWSLFGEARPIQEESALNRCVVELSSVCPKGIDCTSTGEPNFSGITFRYPGKRLTFANIHHLSAYYKIRSLSNGQGDCGGGSPRFSIGIDTNGDGNADGHVFVYIGPVPEFSGCDTNVWQETGNLITNSERRFEIGDLLEETDPKYMSDPVYMTYQEVLARLGGIAQKPVVYVMFVLDGGWLEDQSVLAEKLQVNHFKFTNRECKKKGGKGA